MIKHLYKNIVLMVILITSFSGLHAQTSDWQEMKAVADSSQRIWMRQTLKVNDDVITRVFAIRDSMYSQVNRIRSDKSLPVAEQDNAVLEVRKQAEQKIRDALGHKTYQLYVEAIKQRLQSSGRTSELPLTGTVN